MRAQIQSLVSWFLVGNAVAGFYSQADVAAADDPKPGLEDLLPLSRLAMAEQLRLSDAQRAEANRIVEEFQSQLERIHRAYPAGAQDQEGLTRRRELLTRLGSLRTTTAERLDRLLTREQSERLVKLKPAGSPQLATDFRIRFAQARFVLESSEPQATNETAVQLKRKWSQAQVIDPASGTAIGPSLVHDEERLIVCQAFSTDGRRVATGTGKIPSTWTLGSERGDEGEVRVWEVQSGKLLASYRCDSYVTGVRFRDDGSTVEVMSDPINGR
jgi:hypothetical protein